MSKRKSGYAWQKLKAEVDGHQNGPDATYPEVVYRRISSRPDYIPPKEIEPLPPEWWLIYEQADPMMLLDQLRAAEATCEFLDCQKRAMSAGYVRWYIIFLCRDHKRQFDAGLEARVQRQIEDRMTSEHMLAQVGSQRWIPDRAEHMMESMADNPLEPIEVDAEE